MSLEQLGRLQVYLVTYVLVALLVSLWVLPGLVAALTPIRVRDIFALTRNALLTAFVAGDLFIVLPVLIEASKSLLEQVKPNDPQSAAMPDVIVPASFNFPHTGKLLSISFILFAGWFSDAEVRYTDYPQLALTGLVTFFGSLNVAVPFLLDTFRIPADTFQLFLASGVVNSRFGTLVAAMHTLTVALLGTCAMIGALSWNRQRIVRYAVVTAASHDRGHRGYAADFCERPRSGVHEGQSARRYAPASCRSARRRASHRDAGAAYPRGG